MSTGNHIDLKTQKAKFRSINRKPNRKHFNEEAKQGKM